MALGLINAVMFSVLSLVYLWLAGRVMQGAAKRAVRTGCYRCGYALEGITRPRCPECGQALRAKWMIEAAMNGLKGRLFFMVAGAAVLLSIFHWNIMNGLLRVNRVARWGDSAFLPRYQAFWDDVDAFDQAVMAGVSISLAGMTMLLISRAWVTCLRAEPRVREMAEEFERRVEGNVQAAGVEPCEAGDA